MADFLGSVVNSAGNSVGSQLGGLLGGILGQAPSNQSSNSNSTTTTKTSQLNQDQIDMITSFIGERLGNLNATGEGSDEQKYSKESAITDSQALVQKLIDDLVGNKLPTLANQEAATGGYNTTSKDLLKNDLVASTVGAGAEAQAQLISSYAQILQAAQASDISAILNSLGILKGANVEQTSTTKSNQTVASGGSGLLSKLF